MKTERDLFVKELTLTKPNIRLVGEYMGKMTRTTFSCVCGNIWPTTPYSITRSKYGCPKCARAQITKTQEQFVHEVTQAHPTLKVVGKYISNIVDIAMTCDLGHTWKTRPSTVIQFGCPHCNEIARQDAALQRIKNRPEISEYFDIVSDYVNSKGLIQLVCKNDNYEFERTAGSLVVGRIICPCCGHGSETGKRGTHGHVVRGKNDLWTTHPYIAELLSNPEDGYDHSAQNCVEIAFKCPDCGKVEPRLLSYVSQTMPYCKHCGDKQSYPERFFRGVLKSLGVDFQTEKKFDWCRFDLDGKERFGRYDFYFCVNGQEYIVETDGDQHYRELGNIYKDLSKVQKIDQIKQKLAEDHGIIMVRLDCRISSKDYVRQSIESSLLSTLFDLAGVDWNQCQKETLTSRMVQMAELWNTGLYSANQIAKMVGLKDKGSARYWLKECAEQGLCDYTTEKGKEFQHKNTIKAIATSVTLLNTGETFESAAAAGKEHGANPSHISACCKGTRNYAGKGHDGSQKLVWSYTKDTEGKDIAQMLQEVMGRIEESERRNRESIAATRAARKESRDQSPKEYAFV